MFAKYALVAFTCLSAAPQAFAWQSDESKPIKQEKEQPGELANGGSHAYRALTASAKVRKTPPPGRSFQRLAEALTTSRRLPGQSTIEQVTVDANATLPAFPVVGASKPVDAQEVSPNDQQPQAVGAVQFLMKRPAPFASQQEMAISVPDLPSVEHHETAVESPSVETLSVLSSGSSALGASVSMVQSAGYSGANEPTAAIEPAATEEVAMPLAVRAVRNLGSLTEVVIDTPSLPSLESESSLDAETHEETALSLSDALDFLPTNFQLSDGEEVVATKTEEKPKTLDADEMIGPPADPVKLFGMLKTEHGTLHEQDAYQVNERRDIAFVEENPLSYTWYSPTFYYHPLYFEQRNLERYGVGRARAVQPLLSAAHFYASIPLIPYKSWTHHPREKVYPLGFGRPGNCVPVQRKVLLGESTPGEALLFWDPSSGY